LSDANFPVLQLHDLLKGYGELPLEIQNEMDALLK
jgi:hypothetical protein